MSDHADLICDSCLIVFILSEHFKSLLLHLYHLQRCYHSSHFFISLQECALAKMESFDCAMDWDEILFVWVFLSVFSMSMYRPMNLIHFQRPQNPHNSLQSKSEFHGPVFLPTNIYIFLFGFPWRVNDQLSL